MLHWDDWVNVSGLERIWKRVQDLQYMDGEDIDVFERMKFAEFIIRECASRCGSQSDQRNILTSFGLEVESNIKYPASERDGSVNSQYEREYNLPRVSE